jgi:PIN domain nuclease of toxin-antitoxin system
VGLLLDTHAFIWWNDAAAALGTKARAAIEDPETPVFVSAVTAWEIAVKRSIRKLRFDRDIASSVAANDFQELSITIDHAVGSAELPPHHGDPFDRLLIAQARLEGLTLVTADAAVRQYDVATLDASA